MTLEPTYTEDELRRVGAAIHLSGYISRVIVLSTPDTQLQVLADAWNNGSPSQREALKDWPELYDALEENSDDT